MAEQIGFAGQTAAQKPFRVRLELSEPNERDNFWEVVAVVTVTDKDGEGIEDKEVVFIADGLVRKETTDSDGIARHTFRFGSGTHTIIAKVGGESKKRSVSIAKEDKKKKKPAKLLIHETSEKGKMGSNIILIQVLTENDTPVKDVEVIVLDHSLQEGHTKLPKTGADGMTSWKTSVSENEDHRTVRITVAGSDLKTTTTLFYRTE